MGTNVARVTSSQDAVEQFVDTLFHDQKGYIYSPTKNIKSQDYWQPYFFKWPEQKTGLVTHILSQSKQVDVYLAPSLFSDTESKKSKWQGTKFVWVEFDGNSPETSNLPEGIPEPSIIVQSSEKSHQHWYWELDKYETDLNVIEGLSKNLAYTLQADLSGWDCTQVLRPPGTLHHASRRRVRLVYQNESQYTYDSFTDLKSQPENTKVEQLGYLPEIATVVAKYKWPTEAYDLFKKAIQPTGSRSSALTRLALHCIEMGMTNEESYTILINADDRWKKYVNRNDRQSRLLGIISYARSKKGLQAELNLSEQEPVFTLGDLLSTEINVQWIFKNMLAEQGLGILSANPGVGKSTLSLRMAMNLALQKQFLLWENGCSQPKKIAFISLEMGITECKHFIKNMMESLTLEEQEIVKKQIVIYPLGYALALDNTENQRMLLDIIDEHETDFVIIDSLKAATGAIKEERMDSFFRFINRDLRQSRKTTLWIIHHNRKPNKEGPRKPQDLSDLYGDTFIGAHPTSVISLWKTSKKRMQVLNFKTRLAEETDPFYIERGDNLTFHVVGSNANANANASASEEITKEESEDDGTSHRPSL